LPGQIKIRVRYRKYVTPWFDYLFVSKEEMADMLKGTVWKVQESIEGEGPVYIAIMVKDETKEPGEARV
jgi:hypothetical protein